MHSILARLGADVLVGRMNRMREDERVKLVGPDSWVLPCPTPGPQALDPAFTPMYDGETEVWFDWAFVDFWKANNRKRLGVAGSFSPPYPILSQCHDHDQIRSKGGLWRIPNRHRHQRVSACDVHGSSRTRFFFLISFVVSPLSSLKQRRVAKKVSWSPPFVGSSPNRAQRSRHYETS
jgi:hypothetical protein